MSTVYRVNVCVPAGRWLRAVTADTQALRADWVAAAATAAVAARTPALRQVTVTALVRQQTIGGRAVFAAGDVRASLDAALEGLVAAGVLRGRTRRHVVADSLELGVPTGELEPLLTLELTEVRGDGG